MVDDYLGSLPEPDLGLFISDENKETVQDVERSIRLLRRSETNLRLKHIVEKGFSIDSAKSRVLQLCDLCALSLRKRQERREWTFAPTSANPIDNSGIALVEALIHQGEGQLGDVIAWSMEEMNQDRK